ncbi:Alcohol dehydrogenase 1 [Sparassis crispa]|uniref:alcohol dehydrogenase n=1 Tax=Sparassis crispa TaxID=139825 RepID=A0A401GQJ4_9APHY|nr:Alcohol dehydrogenase 1 [Sparassis crispa]GBE84475.1 Alcohol dehydrogenase 1 [Sparassis crispa]
MNTEGIPTKGVAALTHELGIRTQLTTEYPVKQPSKLAPGECLVKLECTGVCHSDLHFMSGDWPFKPRFPSAGGHEGIGRVLAIGAQTPPGEVKIGDRVGIQYVSSSCLKCEMCRTGFPQHCPEEKVTGHQDDGTFTQYTVAFVDHVVPIPENIPSQGAAPILCAGVTVYKALKLGNTSVGNWIAIPGSGGGLGHLAIQYAVAMGLRVIAIDAGDEKRTLSLSLGAEKFVDFVQSANVVKDVIAAADGAGPHAAIVLTDSNRAYIQAAYYTRPQGTILCVGLPPEPLSGLSLTMFIGKGLKLVGSKTGNRQETIEALQLVSRGKVTCQYEERPFAELNSVLEQMKKGTLVGRVVLTY